MIQKSLSPVVKSMISSLSGRTMRVEKRSFARIGTMSSLRVLHDARLRQLRRAPAKAEDTEGEQDESGDSNRRNVRKQASMFHR